MSVDQHDADAGIRLYWLPLGADDPSHLVRWNGWVYEWVAARRGHRRVADLYHAALQVDHGSASYTIEMAPAWRRAENDRGVVCSGPVGAGWLGRSRYFRYEVRCWRDGCIPDLHAAVNSPVRVDTDDDRTAALLALAPRFPTLIWGRDQLGTGDMWNSNSLVSWLLASSRHDVDALRPPPGGRAPGWAAGLVAALSPDGPAQAASALCAFQPDQL